MSKLVYEIKKLNGFVLGVGYLKDKFLKEMDKNPNIEVDLLTNNEAASSKIELKKSEKKKKGKNVSIKKIKKIFKKRRPNYIICNVDDIESYLRYFVKDSISITNHAIYVFSDSKKSDLNDVKHKYERYIKDIDINDEYIVINTVGYKRNIFKNIWYFIIDTFVAIYDFIGTIIAG